MAFSGGGTNVGGVQQRDAGILKINNGVISATANGTYNIDLVVPSGKVYLIKASRNKKAAGTYTVSTIALQIIDGSATAVTYATQSSDNFSSMVGDQNYYVPEGFTIRASFTVTGWSIAGALQSLLLYQEMDS